MKQESNSNQQTAKDQPKDQQQTQTEVFFYLSKKERDYFIEQFYEKKSNDRNDIHFNDFRNIVLTYKRFDGEATKLVLDSIKKGGSDPDNVISNHLNEIDLDEFLGYLETIAIQQERLENERDPELNNLFLLLSGGNTTLRIQTLIDIITNFELPIIIQDFFAPLPKKEKDNKPKEDLNFSDFCLLFRSKTSHTEIFLRTFNGSIPNTAANTANSTTANFNKNLFPIEVKKNEKIIF